MTVSMISKNHREQLTWRRRALLAAAAALAAGTIIAEVVLSADPPAPPAARKPTLLPYDAKPKSPSSTRLSDYIQRSSRRSLSGASGTPATEEPKSATAPSGGPTASTSLSDRSAGERNAEGTTSGLAKAPASLRLSSRRTPEELAPPKPQAEAADDSPSLVRLNVDRNARPVASEQELDAPTRVTAAGGESPRRGEPTLAAPAVAESTRGASEPEETPKSDGTEPAESSEPTAESNPEAPAEPSAEMPAEPMPTDAAPEAPTSDDASGGDEPQPADAPSAENPAAEAPLAEAPAAEAPSEEPAPEASEPAAAAQVEAPAAPPPSRFGGLETPRPAPASRFEAPSRANPTASANPTKRVLTVIGMREKEEASAAPAVESPVRPASPAWTAPSRPEPRASAFIRQANEERAATTLANETPAAEGEADAAPAEAPAAEAPRAPQSVASNDRPATRALRNRTDASETAWRTLQDAPAADAGQPFEVIEQSGEMSVTMRRSKLLVLKREVVRVAIVDPNVADVVQFTPKEMSVIGKSVGATHVTFWFDDANQRPVTYLVNVEPDAKVRQRLEEDYRKLEALVTELFPDSLVRLVPMADKLIVKGQAKDAEEAAQILSLLRNQGSGGMGGGMGGMNLSLNGGTATQLYGEDETGAAQRPRIQIINMLRVPGVHQIALRVKIAELNRTAARNFGVGIGGHVNFTSNPKGSQLFVQSMLGLASGGATGAGAAAPTFLAQFDGDDIRVGIRYMQQAGVLRLMSEPTLVTLSGQPATFVAGGEFAVPTLVGSVGLNAVTTDFRAYGAIISFMPTVVDKDRIRLQVAPEFSQINSALTNAQTGTPGLNVRAVTTTVEMREGQTFAIAGLLEDTMKSATGSDIPFLHKLFGNREVNREETELIILVTPELVHPMDPEEVPPLPGFDVTEPSNLQFFLKGDIEGTPTRDWRSPVWPRLRQRYNAGGSSMISGPFGHGQ